MEIKLDATRLELLQLEKMQTASAAEEAGDAAYSLAIAISEAERGVAEARQQLSRLAGDNWRNAGDRTRALAEAEEAVARKQAEYEMLEARYERAGAVADEAEAAAKAASDLCAACESFARGRGLPLPAKIEPRRSRISVAI